MQFVEPDRPMTEAELKERRRQLALLSRYHVMDAYREAHRRCCMSGDRLADILARYEMPALRRCNPCRI